MVFFIQDGMPDLVIDDITTVDNVHQLTLIQDPNIPSFSIEEGQDQVNPMIVEAISLYNVRSLRSKTAKEHFTRH